MTTTTWANAPNDQDWWDRAYGLFLHNHPLTTLSHYLEFRLVNPTWDDFGFTATTPIPIVGFHDGVDKKAILLVIAKSRKMNAGNWNTLHQVPAGIPPPLTDADRLLINTTIRCIFASNGTPI